MGKYNKFIIEKDILKKLYIDENKTKKEIAQTFRVAEVTIYKNILRFKLKKIHPQQICPACNMKFIPYKLNQISCSDICSKKYYAINNPKPKKDRFRFNIKRQKICPYCKNSFYDNSYSNCKTFCCENHSKKNYKEQVLIPKHNEINKQICLECEKKFVGKNVFKYDIPFCSVNCCSKFCLKNSKIGFILGAIYSDGFINTKKKINLGLNVRDKDYAEYFADCLHNVFYFIKRPNVSKTCDNRFRVNISRGILVKAISNLMGGDKKCFSWGISNIIIKNRHIHGELLRGFFDGDGSIRIINKYKHGCIYGYSSNYNGLKQIEIILNSLGINSRFHTFNRSGKKSVINGKDVITTKDMNVIVIGDRKSIIEFKNKVGFSIKRKQDKLDRIVSNFRIERKKYTSEDFDFISKNRHLSDEEISTKLGKTKHSIKNMRLKKLHILIGPECKRYKKEDVKFIIDNYGKLTYQEMGKKLLRKPRSIITKVYRLKKRNINNNFKLKRAYTNKYLPINIQSQLNPLITN